MKKTKKKEAAKDWEILYSPTLTEKDEASGSEVLHSSGSKTVLKKLKGLETIGEQLGSSLRGLAAKVGSESVEQVEVSLGVSLGVKGKIILVGSGHVSAHINMKIVWKNKSDENHG